MTNPRNEPSKSYLLNDTASFSREKDRLRKQAEQLAQLEREALIQAGLTTPHRVLELGCGNGQYLLQWQKAFPNTQFAGVDRNEKLLELAREELPSATFFHHDLLNFECLAQTFQSFKPDTVILRFVLQHLTDLECSRILKFLREQSELATYQLLVIDPNDSTISFSPDCEELKSATAGVIRKQANNGGDRTRGSRLKQECEKAGFTNTKETAINVGSATIGWDGVKSILVPLWKQGTQSDNSFAAIMDWLKYAEHNAEASYFKSDVHLVIAR